MLDLADPDHKAPLLLSGARAAALNLANEIHAADPDSPVAVTRTAWLDSSAALTMIDPGQDIARAPRGPLSSIEIADGVQASAALRLARLAGLLPALWLLDDSDRAEKISRNEVMSGCDDVAIVARAQLPLEELPPSQIVVFRAASDGQEHVALVIGAFAGGPPLVRLHSECLTGDVFGSLKCDCGPQLREALRLLGDAGGGILLYLRQEGRGIGIANKVRAYALQDRGLDTVDANRRLGFADDERNYLQAAAMLRALGADRVRLLTNNPDKVAGLSAAGITVVDRIRHQMPTNPHNAEYLATKRRRSGHLS
jgi:GTP cyclohydrolase II